LVHSFSALLAVLAQNVNKLNVLKMCIIRSNAGRPNMRDLPLRAREKKHNLDTI